MKKMKVKLLTAAILTAVIATSTPVFAATNSSTSTEDTLISSQVIQTTGSSVTVDSNDDLSKKELSSIKENINSILSSKYEIMKTGKHKNFSNIIGDSKLLELVDKTNDLSVNWFKNFTKIDTYTSKVTVTNSTKTATNTYVLNVLYDIKFKLHGMSTLSQSENERYRFEVKCKDGKWYITKMVDLNDEDVDASTESNQIIAQTNRTSDSAAFSNYNNSIDLQIKNIEEKSKNIDNAVNYYKMQNNSKNANISTLASSTYQYNPSAAVSYARKYALSPNSAYTYYTKNGDCTNFVSQCVYAGGIPQNPGVWMPGQYDWNTVGGFYTYMTNYGYAKGYTWTNGARIGDVVQWYNPSTKVWSHAVILTGTTSNDWLYCSHSNDRKDYPLYASYQSSTFTDLRTIAFWH